MAKIYWYPGGAPGLKTIDLGFISDLEEDTPAAVYGRSEAIAGSVSHQHWGDWRQITIEREGLVIDDAAIIRDLRSLQSHLMAGGSIGYSSDSGDTWLSFALSGPPQQGDTSILTGPNSLVAWEPTATLTTGDEIVIQSAAPDGYREWHRVSTFTVGGSGALIGLTEAVRYDHPTGPVLVRWHRSWAVLVLRDDAVEQPILSSPNQGLTWTLTLALREDVPGTYQLEDNPLSDTTATGGTSVDVTRDDGTAGAGNPVTVG